MGQQVLKRRSAELERQWLAALVEAMEEAARPQRQATPRDLATMMALQAKLARPASIGAVLRQGAGASEFRLSH